MRVSFFLWIQRISKVPERERIEQTKLQTAVVGWSLLGLVSIGLNLLESYGSTMAEIQSIGRKIACNFWMGQVFNI